MILLYLDSSTSSNATTQEMRNVASFLFDGHPDQVVLINADDLSQRYTRGDLQQRASAIASLLADIDCKPGDKIALYLDNSIEFVDVFFGVLMSAMTVVPIPISYTPPEIGARLRHSNSRAIIVRNADTLKSNKWRHALDLKRIIALDDCPKQGSKNLQSTNDIDVKHVDPDDIAMLLYTSGTTGSAKAACISHRALTTHTKALVRDSLQLQNGDKVLGVLPFTHSYGLRMTVLAPLIAGATTYFHTEFDPLRSLETICSENIDWIAAVPTMFSAWANCESAPKPTSLRWCLSAGAPLSIDIGARAEKALNASIRQGYGLTEATFCTINAPPDDAIAESVGKPVGDVSIRIVDASANDVPQGTSGEVWVHGSNLMRGYLDDVQDTAEVLANGWLRTGDVGYLDEFGRLYLIDRIKDVVLVGGRNVYPAEVENILTQHPSVAQAAVFGIPHDHYGEEIVAAIVLHPGTKPTVEDLDKWIRERLANFKVPRRYFFIDSFPTTASGKISKRELRSVLFP
ncbi:MAG: AMP-binding protein [Polyangiales bacterium]